MHGSRTRADRKRIGSFYELREILLEALYLGPVVIQSERRVSTTSLISSSPINGGENGRNLSRMVRVSDYGIVTPALKGTNSECIRIESWKRGNRSSALSALLWTRWAVGGIRCSEPFTLQCLSETSVLLFGRGQLCDLHSWRRVMTIS